MTSKNTKTIMLFALFCSFFFSVIIRAQYNHNKNYDLHPPLKIPLVLAGNFGELRSNHFHTGLDFKTNRKEGYKIYSIADGYVSRIKVSPWGYGHVIYITHYNGLSSVYAHCSGFIGEIKELVESQQSKQQNFAFEYYPEKDSLKVSRGQAIALSGNTGGSTAPHLHFEIRDASTEEALNPLLFGFDIKDTRKPLIRGVKVYGLTPEGYRVPHKAKTLNTIGGNGNYQVSGNKITIPANYGSHQGGIGFAFDAVDQLDAANNICGIFQAILIVNGDTIFRQNMTRIAFESNRYINCHKDYEEYRSRRKHFHKAFKTIHNPLPIYTLEKNNGILSIHPDSTYQIEYICVDTENNQSRLKFDLVVSSGEMSDLSDLYLPYANYLFPESGHFIREDNYLVLFTPNLIYEPTPLYEERNSSSFTFGKTNIPVQEYYRVMFKAPNELAHLPTEKLVITRENEKGRKYAEKTHYSDGWLTTWVRDFGKFYVSSDTIPPTIVANNVYNGKKITGQTLRWRINDNFSGVWDYDVYIDDEWYLLQYEPKAASSYFFQPPSDLKGKKQLTLRAEDGCGNVSEVSYSVIF